VSGPYRRRAVQRGGGIPLTGRERLGAFNHYSAGVTEPAESLTSEPVSTNPQYSERFGAFKHLSTGVTEPPESRTSEPASTHHTQSERLGALKR
jgi:hypothetical protein